MGHTVVAGDSEWVGAVFTTFSWVGCAGGPFKASPHIYSSLCHNLGPDLTTSIRIVRRTLDALDVQNLGQCGFKKKCCRHRRCLRSRTNRWSKFSQLAILKTGEKQQEFCWQQKNNLITWSNSTVKLHRCSLSCRAGYGFLVWQQRNDSGIQSSTTLVPSHIVHKTWIHGSKDVLSKIIMTAYKLDGSNYVFYMPSCHPTA